MTMLCQLFDNSISLMKCWPVVEGIVKWPIVFELYSDQSYHK